MNENRDSKKDEENPHFTLEVKIPDQPTKRLKVLDRLLAGLDPRNDLILIDPVVKTKHMLFKKQNNVLCVHYLGNDGESFLNGHELEKGKLYVLEKGDLLKVGSIEICIHQGEELSPIPTEERSHSRKLKEPKTKEHTTEKSARPSFVIPNQAPKIKIVAGKREPIFNFSTINLIPYKFYGFILDVAFTYFILSFVIPSLGLLQEILEILYPINQFINEAIHAYYPPFAKIQIDSLIEFFICFHVLMIATSLILGTTPGAFITGLHSKPGRSSFLGTRFKAYLYALLNIVLLPLLIFDFPFYKGKTLKELLTFSEREISTSGFFKIVQRIIAPSLLFATLLAPFLLPPPFMATITEINNKASKLKDVHSQSVISKAATIGLTLNTELNDQYHLLPSFKAKKWGMTLYDLNSNQALIMQENKRLDYKTAFFQLRYANPLASLHLKGTSHNAEECKKRSLDSLGFTLEKIPNSLEQYGPFMANDLLFKNLFLHAFSSQDNFFMNSFDKQNPAIKISSNNNSQNEERLFLFTQKQIIEFSLQIPKNSKLLDVFVSKVIAGLKFIPYAHNLETSGPQILEVIESFEEGKTETILTYYINEVKKAQELQNLDWSAFLKKNILQTKMALTGIERRKGEKALEELANSL